ncbi:MAG: cation:proton antiporter, partial [Kaistella sp.]
LMTIIAIIAKYVAAVATQKTFRLTKEQGGLIFGLSAAHAAATLAIVMVGYNIIIGETEAGQPIRLLDESVLNGSILLILVSCTVSSFVTQKNAQKLVKTENENPITDANPEAENILLAVNHPVTVEPMTNLSLLLKSKSNKENIYVLNIINEEKNESSRKNAEKLLHQAQNIGASADVKITPLTRYDADVIKGVSNEIKVYQITDLMIGVDPNRGFSQSFVYNLYNGYLNNISANMLVYHAAQPVSTIHKYLVVLPEKAHLESGFFHSLLKVWNIARNSGSKIEFYGNEKTIKVIENIKKKVNIDASFIIFNDWNEMRRIYEKMKENDALILFMANPEMVSFLPQMQQIPNALNEYFRYRNYLLVYPSRKHKSEYEKQTRDIANADDFVEIGNIVGRIFK